MGSFGERMQRERQLRGVTLEEISVVTKIGTRSLRALEEEEFDKLPGGIFNKGFVRAYARYLGIDPDEAVADYLAAMEQRNSSGVDTTAGVPPGMAPIPDLAIVEEPQEPQRGIPLFAILAVAAVVVGTGWFLSRHRSLNIVWDKISGRQPQPEASIAKGGQELAAPPASVSPVQGGQSVPAAQVSASPAAAQPIGRAPVLAEVSPSLLSPTARAAEERAAAAAKAAAEARAAAGAQPPTAEERQVVSTAFATVPVGEGFTVHLRAAQDCWLTVTADGKQVTTGLLAAGDERSIRAGRRVIVRLGNAGGVRLAFNGKELPSVGAPGEVRTVAFGPDGRETYTPPTPAPVTPAPRPAANPPNPQ